MWILCMPYYFCKLKECAVLLVAQDYRVVYFIRRMCVYVYLPSLPLMAVGPVFNADLVLKFCENIKLDPAPACTLANPLSKLTVYRIIRNFQNDCDCWFGVVGIFRSYASGVSLSRFAPLSDGPKLIFRAGFGVEKLHFAERSSVPHLELPAW